MGFSPPLKIGLVAGAGQLPVEVVGALQGRGYSVVPFALRGEACPTLETYGAQWISWGQIGRFIKLARAAACRDFILVGAVTRRPDFLSLLGDPGTLRRIPRLLRLLSSGGDNSVLTAVIRLFEEEGFRIVGLQEFVPEFLIEEGLVTGPAPSEAVEKDLLRGFEVAHLSGAFDIGQSVVVVDRRVIALEAAEGTDAMLARCAALKKEGRVRWSGQRGVLVKCVKEGQDRRLDLPTIGPATVEAVAAAGLAGIAVSAGSVLIAERSRTLALAQKRKLFLFGHAARHLGDSL